MTEPARGSTTTPDTILVVDDNATNRLLAEAMLSSAGYKVVVAESGLAAIKVFESAKPDLVLLDLLMPGMDGFELFGRLRALPGGPRIPMVFLTAFSDHASIQKAIELGADDFLTKPVNRAELLVRVSAQLAGRRRNRDTPAPTAAAVSEAEFRRQDDDKRREELAALLVHDLKHPLTTIYFSAGMLRRDPSLSQQALEKVNRIQRAAELLDSMVMGILDVARSEDGALRLNLSDVEIGALLDEVTRSMGPLAELNRQRLEVRADLDILTVKADRELLRRTLENLIDNSTKYAPPSTAIRVEAKASGTTVEFRVRDEGPGIPPEFRQKIFTKYAQLERDARRRGRTSRGLGLALCRVAVEAHGGRLWVESNEPRGSCFCVEVPNRVSTETSLSTSPAVPTGPVSTQVVPNPV